MNQTKEVLTKTYNLSYDSEMGVLFHWSRHRGWVPLARNKTKKGAYYVFKHEGRPTYVNEKVVLEAFNAEEPRRFILLSDNTNFLKKSYKKMLEEKENGRKEEN